RILRPSSASAAPRLIAVVVLPTPPFWLATAMIRGAAGRIGSGTRQSFDDKYGTTLSGDARDWVEVEGPFFSRLVNFALPACALGKDRKSVGRQMARRKRQQLRQWRQRPRRQRSGANRWHQFGPLGHDDRRQL